MAKASGIGFYEQIIIISSSFIWRMVVCWWHAHYCIIQIALTPLTILHKINVNYFNDGSLLISTQFPWFFSLSLSPSCHNFLFISCHFPCIFSYEWHRVVFFYERDGHYNVGGLHTCHLLMQTMANTYRTKNITYSPFATDSAVGSNTTENLKREVGLDQASK